MSYSPSETRDHASLPTELPFRTSSVMLLAHADQAPTSLQTQASPSRRDTRIDALRGLALLMIFADHITNNFLKHFTYQQFSYSTAAWLFVLLAGISFAYKHTRILQQRGLRASLTSTFRRIQSIYCAHLVTLLLSAGLLSLLTPMLSMSIADLHLQHGFEPLTMQPLAALAHYAALYYQPTLFDILPLYIALLALGPLQLWGLRRAPWLTFWLSGLLYACALAAPTDVTLPAWNRSEGWPFNPLAWQFLFMIGLAVGTGCLGLPKHPSRRRAVLAASLALVAFAVPSRMLAHVDNFYAWAGGEEAHWLVHLDRLESWRPALHPITVLHVLSVLVVLDALVPRDSHFARSRLLQPLAELGQHSLEVFAVSILLSILCSALFLAWQPRYLAQLFIQLSAMLLMWLFARFQSAAKRADARVVNTVAQPHVQASSMHTDHAHPAFRPSRIT